MKKASKTTTLTAPAVSAPIPAKKVLEKPAVKKVAEKAPVAAPVVKTSPAVVVTTKIVAQVDVGFGNTLFIRGEGPGLSWEKGLPLDCVADDQWALTVAETSRPVVCKFLINDLTWSLGDDYIVQPGSSVVLTPTF